MPIDFGITDKIPHVESLVNSGNMDSPMQRFGEKLRSLRKQYRLTQIELAQRLGYTAYSYISEVETGKLMPSLELALKVSRLFQVPTDQLLKDELEVDLHQVALDDPPRIDEIP